MQTLILSVSAGGGHVNAAEAIESYIKLDNPENSVKVIDTIKHINPFLDKIVIGSYLKSLKLTPSLFGKLYNMAEKGESIASFSNMINEMITHKLMPLINDFRPDLIVTTHPFSAEMASILKRKGKISAPIVNVLTDYAPHSFWIHPNIDAYIVSNDEMVPEMIRRGVNHKIIHPLGIPVKPGFICNFSREATLASLDLSLNKTTVLLMGGSLGMGKISTLYEELQKVEEDIQIIVITGNNKKLFSQLNLLSNTSAKTTRVIGYTKEVNKYMQACDLLITKPGGLTITEALISNIPLALFSAIPGQEEKNADFLVRNNLAVDLGDAKNCSSVINTLLSSENKIKTMKDNCSRYARPNCGSDIVELLNTLIQQNNQQINNQP